MKDFAISPGMVPYQAIFPTSDKGVLMVTLPRKVGKVRAGDYAFIETYCVSEGCDCRRTNLLVIDEKGTQKALIEFGFDPEEPFAGPYLAEEVKQSAAATDLLQIFVDAVNDNADFLKGMHRRYKQVRNKIDGPPYRGQPFPKPGTVKRVVQPCELDESFFAELEELFTVAEDAAPGQRKAPKVNPRQGDLFGGLPSGEPVTDLIDRLSADGPPDAGDWHDDRIRTFLSSDADAPEQLAAHLVASFQEENESRLEESLQLLNRVLEILRTDLERRRPGSRRQMEACQGALAQHVFAPGVPHELGVLVTQVLLESRVEILPLLHEANSARMFASVEGDVQLDGDPETILLDLLGELEEANEGTPFFLMDALLQMLAVGGAEVQVNLCRLMLEMEHPLVREAAVLMIFHPHGEVRAGVARLLGDLEGRFLTPDSLRRLILARNWFPEDLRRDIDRAIANARRARVECAPLAKRLKPVIYASAIDGAMAQTFQIFLSQGKGFLCCGILPKRGAGIADAFTTPLANKGQRNQLRRTLEEELGALVSSPDYLDQRVCQALADGARHGLVPSHWLVAIAEQLGIDRWKAVPFDAQQELADLRADLERRGGKLLDGAVDPKARLASACWPEEHPFAWSWFEDDAEVDALIRTAERKKGRFDADRCLEAILDQIMEPRREKWLECLVLTTQWARASKKAPVSWMELYRVAAAVADQQTPLKRIPLMIAIAENSLDAYFGRQEEERAGRGGLR